jgi:hypothetical protein
MREIICTTCGVTNHLRCGQPPAVGPTAFGVVTGDGGLSATAKIFQAALCVRVRLQSCRKISKKMLGFSRCVFYFHLFAIQQWLKPESNLGICGTTEVVP